MAHMSLDDARRIESALRAVPPDEVLGLARPEIRLRVSERGDRARVELVLRDPRSGNSVYREADRGSDALALVREAVREIRSRGRATRRRISAERASS